MEGADMSKSLAVRTRVLAAILSGLSCRQAAILWSERLERDPLPEDGTVTGRRDAEGGSGATGARRAWTVMRVPIRTLVDETPDITLEELKTALAVRHLWQAMARCGASLTATRSRANKAAHSTEQDRPEIVKRREPGSMASRNLDPDRLPFNTATPDLDQHLPPLRIGAEMARGSEPAFPGAEVDHRRTATRSRSGCEGRSRTLSMKLDSRWRSFHRDRELCDTP
jgi:hypothetical protein